MTAPPVTRHAFVVDFGRGSREQSQGGAARNESNVHPIRQPADAVDRG